MPPREAASWILTTQAVSFRDGRIGRADIFELRRRVARPRPAPAASGRPPVTTQAGAGSSGDGGAAVLTGTLRFGRVGVRDSFGSTSLGGVSHAEVCAVGDVGRCSGLAGTAGATITSVFGTVSCAVQTVASGAQAGQAAVRDCGEYNDAELGRRADRRLGRLPAGAPARTRTGRSSASSTAGAARRSARRHDGDPARARPTATRSSPSPTAAGAVVRRPRPTCATPVRARRATSA